MAITVKVFINEYPLLTIRAVRIKGKPHEMCVYQLSGGRLIEHHYDDGARKLAIKLLEG